MSIAIDWFDAEHTIIRYQFEGRWTWDDLYGAITQVNTMLASVDHKVDVIIDFERSLGVPPGALTHLRSNSLRAADNWNGGVFVGVNPFIRALLSAFLSVNRKLTERYAVANTMGEAQAIIQRWRAKK
jgi:hypothetical protein